jgi:predicted HTH domain antitoxin
LKGLVKIGLYESEEKAIYEALRLLLKEHPDYRKKLAVYRYQTEDITLGKAAEVAGVSLETMKQILVDNGVEPELGPETIEEAQQECLNMRKIINERNRK